MSDYLDPSDADQPDNGLKPAASLTSIPVRRRRKAGAIALSERPAVVSRRTGAETAEPPAKPRKETFGRRPYPAAPAAASPTPEESAALSAPETAPQDDDIAATRSSSLPPEGIIALWEGIAGETSIPSLFDLDMAKVAAHWPNSLLLRASGGPRRPVVEVARIFSADAAHDAAPLPIDTMTIDWMMALAREVTHDGVPVHELDNVNAEDPSAEYGVIALPFGASPDAVDHVLCHLYRYEGPPAEEAHAQARAARSAGHKPARKMMASIFGRRQSATG